MYRLTDTGSIVRISDGAFIPSDADNIDYRAYLEWSSAGNDPSPYAAPQAPIPKSVTRRQAFQAMEEAGILDAVISWADSQPRSVRIDFDQSASFDLGNPLIEQASAALGLTDDDVLGLFAIASTK